MAGKTITITPEIKKLVGRIQEKFSPEKILLFGSRAKSQEFKHSDWDLLIISEKFEGIPFRDRIDLILELADYPIGQDIEPFCYTPKEIQKRKNEIGIVKTALETGIELKN